MFDNFWLWFAIGGYFGGYLATFLHLRSIPASMMGIYIPLWQEILYDGLMSLAWPFMFALAFYSWIMDTTR